MSLKDKEKWDKKYRAEECLAGRAPCAWLVENEDFLPATGRALDLAMGEGRNALHAATLGFEVLGIDISHIGASRAQDTARKNQLPLKALVADLDSYPLPHNHFDLVLCFYFMERALFPSIMQSVRPGGWVMYETFTVDHLKYSGLKREWVLEPNELLNIFQEFRIVHYREQDKDEKAVASLLAQKPLVH